MRNAVTSGGKFLLLWAVLSSAAVAYAAPPSRLRLELDAAGLSAPRGGMLPIDAFAHIDPGWHINAHKPSQPFLVATELTLELPQGVTHEPIEYPPPDKRKFAFAGDETLLVYEGKLGLATALRVPASYAGDHLRVVAKLRYQACNDSTCLPPQDATATLEMPVVAATAADLEAVGRLDGDASASQATSGAGQQQLEKWLAERGLLVTLLLVALLGLGLNLTPCVYPLISVTVAYFGSQAKGRRGVTWLAALYVLGIALSFSAVGLAAALSGGMFGQALQKPIVVLFIAAVMVALALSSFGLYQLQPPASLMRWAGGGSGSGAAGALFMGLTMGVVAAPCVGPIVLGLLVFVGSRQDPFLGFLLFFVLALGMGLPYLALAAAAGSIKQLPRSGEWLMWTERLFGCVLLAMAAYFVSPLLPSPWTTYLLPAVIASSGIYLGFVESAGGGLRFFPSLKRGVGVAMLGAAVWFASPPDVAQPIAWQPIASLQSSVEGHGDAKPLLIDFAAAWCIPCREMDHTTYVDSSVVHESERFRMVRADITEENEQTTKLVDRYEVRGVPTVILLSANGEEKQRLVGYVAADELLAAMKEVN
jgi:thioredoxin:protein disulfide reductase